MKFSHLWHCVASVALALPFANAACAAEAFPSHPIRIIVNTAPGGLTDITTRLVAQKMGEHLKQTVIVDNRAGGDGLIGIRAAKSAAPDGYTLLGTAGTIAIQMAAKAEPGYDLLKDFTGIGIMGRSPFLLVVDPRQPYRTVKELVAAAKADPSKVTYASAGVGTVTHLAAESFLQQEGLKLMHVPYKGNGAAMPDVMAGRVTMIFEAYGSSSGKIKAGQLRALGLSSTKRLASLPDVPTFIEQGLPHYTFYTWLALVAPTGTPKEAVQRLSEALRAALSSKEVEERFAVDGVEAIDMKPAEFNRFLEGEVKGYAKLVNDLGIPKQ